MSVFTAPEQMCQPKSMNFVRKMYVGTRIPSVEPHGLARGFSQEKCRRNNRVLSKFYDATYIDIRDGKKKKSNALGCNRTKRRESRRSEKNERIYRGKKMSKGRIVLRTKRAVIRPGDIVYVGKKKYIVASSKNLGKQLKLADGSLLTTSKVTKIIHCGGWKTVTM